MAGADNGPGGALDRRAAQKAEANARLRLQANTAGYADPNRPGAYFDPASYAGKAALLQYQMNQPGTSADTKASLESQLRNAQIMGKLDSPAARASYQFQAGLPTAAAALPTRPMVSAPIQQVQPGVAQGQPMAQAPAAMNAQQLSLQQRIASRGTPGLTLNSTPGSW